MDPGGVPPPKTLTRREKKRLNMNDKKKAINQGPPVDWRWCVIPIEIKTERTRGSRDGRAVFQLGTYAREVLAAQPHRRFVPSLLFTESTVELFLWDRAGVIFSEVLDYHAKAARFCGIIATIVSWTDEELGFDTSVQFEDGRLRIFTRSDAYLVDIVAPLSYNIRSNGSTCWKARRSDDCDRWHIYLIHDAWSDNWASSLVVRTAFEEVRLKNRLLSPAEWFSFEPVHTLTTLDKPPAWRRHVDSVASNRRLVGVTGNLDHGRSVWRCGGGECVPLEKFNGILELLCALRDVVQELKILFLDAKMTHRDITLWNIYIHRRTEGQPRGFLVDFSHAAFMDGSDIAPRSDKTPVGTMFT
ncbi:hypothetical protein JB92DRAFT_1671568 [Gautieria morchelliformis]|nr:hypothetical protein JB92DRAFT_1671568 [Gautieria morchelliformis]